MSIILPYYLRTPQYKLPWKRGCLSPDSEHRMSGSPQTIAPPWKYDDLLTSVPVVYKYMLLLKWEFNLSVLHSISSDNSLLYVSYLHTRWNENRFTETNAILLYMHEEVKGKSSLFIDLVAGFVLSVLSPSSSGLRDDLQTLWASIRYNQSTHAGEPKRTGNSFVSSVGNVPQLLWLSKENGVTLRVQRSLPRSA